jgi:hypothetical protein
MTRLFGNSGSGRQNFRDEKFDNLGLDINEP